MKTIGVMLDCSRNAVRNIETLKKFIDTSRKIGMNRLYLYIEDTYEIEGEPYFGYMRGRYSIKELQEINAYGREKGVELVPCFQTLAHLNQAFRWPQYDAIRDINDILLMEDERTYQLIDRMFASLSKSFSCANYNVGMDEAFMLGHGKYFQKNGLKSKVDLFMNHLNRVNEIAHKYGKTISIWSDMLYRTALKSDVYYATGTKFDEEFIRSIPKDVTLIYWDYYHEDEKTYHGMIRGHKALGTKVSFASGIWTWAGFVPSNSYAFRVLKPGITAALKEGIDDIIITAWGDNGGECAAFSSLPACFYSAELAKGITRMNDIKADFLRTFGIRWDTFMKLDLPNLIDRSNIHVNPGKYLVYNDPFIGTLDSTLAGNENEKYAAIYRKLRRAGKEMGEYSYLADYMASLAKFLSVKACLGYRTRRAYDSGDKEGLKVLLKDYRLAGKYLKEFIQTFKNAWYRENKPFGFEIQEFRLGGLLQRLSDCADELGKYVNGEIGSIPELEEPILDMHGVTGGKTEGKPELYNCYITNSSMNIF